MKCPMCRQDVSCLLPLYSRAETTQEQNDDLNRVFAAVQTYNRRFSGAPRNVSLSNHFSWNFINLINLFFYYLVLGLYFGYTDSTTSRHKRVVHVQRS